MRKKTVFIFTLGIILFIISTGVVSADDKANISPRSIKFIVEEPVAEIPANHSLTIRRRKKDTEHIYYTVVDYSNLPTNLAKYIMAKTPYNSDYSSLDQPILFLAKGNQEATIYLKLRLDDDFWNNVPDGEYDLELVSTRGKSVKISLRVKKNVFITVTPNSINIFADKGPGLYESQETVKVYINSINSRWNLDINATPLLYQGKQGRKNNHAIQPADIYLSTDGGSSFRNLERTYCIEGNNYGNVASIDMFFKVDIGYEHLAGNYRGRVIITISED